MTDSGDFLRRHDPLCPGQSEGKRTKAQYDHIVHDCGTTWPPLANAKGASHSAKCGDGALSGFWRKSRSKNTLTEANKRRQILQPLRIIEVVFPVSRCHQ
jgi:hypothetical protein